VQNPAASPSPSLAFVPAPCGWRATAATAHGESSVQETASFAEAVAAGFALIAELRLDKSGKVVPATVALPARYAVFERLTLPSGDREELAGMVRLQFEKSLPYPAEETAFGFQILSQTATASAGGGEESRPGVQTTLLACGAHHPAIATLCAPLLERQFPQCLTPWAMHVAAQAPAGEVSCGLWLEEGELLFAIFENRRLGFVEILASPDDVLSALPRALMSAEMAGVPTEFRAVLLDPALAALAERLTAFLGAPIREIAPHLSEMPEGDVIDLTPESWRTEQACKERFRKRRSQLVIAAAVYAAILIAALVYLEIQNGRLEALKKEAATLQPRVDAVVDQQARWKALAPAIDQRRFAVELLFQTCKSLPNPDARITRFDLAQNQFMVEGETPNAQQAVEFGEKLKGQPALSDFRFESGQPVILANEHAQFRIFGKL